MKQRRPLALWIYVRVQVVSLLTLPVAYVACSWRVTCVSRAGTW